ncbi:hypothetical protein SAMD00019534_044240 [Acytostelium subglobosum LB1]|uniref:hypothetical protein n=1 Tax=Acytostelium subglobosum LB1 TaxID=1410327 RepID=UPI000644B730|nr:hypothetical protein SAMD00019534_044240 [Acytostelium subglobosum LB1]GAM21249.1 hypothetical protein SAMD00019534_044240 [Acytostelium subglobosum LB1]|eukprot:XP_012755368.1 hypothetical protein SAMD00019534_044240 [Acytostelium subglobosum LB1]
MNEFGSMQSTLGSSSNQCDHYYPMIRLLKWNEVYRVEFYLDEEHPIPPDAKSLIISANFKGEIRADLIPETLTTLYVDSSPRYIKPSILFPTPEVVMKGTPASMPNPMPPSLTRLIVGDFFDGPLPPLPASITHLILGERFTQRKVQLPSSLTSLTLATFNQIKCINITMTFKWQSGGPWSLQTRSTKTQSQESGVNCAE